MSLYDRTWGRIFATLYDRMLKANEDAGLADIRADVVGRASGRTIEIGAGSGLNVEHYRDGVTHLVLTEPFAPMANQAAARASSSSLPIRVVEAPAERLPFEDGEFDAAVCTLVLCTVDDPEATIAELSRVLKPGGRLHFVEHVRSDDPKIAKRQDRWHGPWKFVAHGCRDNRDSLAALKAGGFVVDQLTKGALPGPAPSIVKPLIHGTATKAT